MLLVADGQGDGVLVVGRVFLSGADQAQGHVEQVRFSVQARAVAGDLLDTMSDGAT